MQIKITTLKLNSPGSWNYPLTSKQLFFFFPKVSFPGITRHLQSFPPCHTHLYMTILFTELPEIEAFILKGPLVCISCSSPHPEENLRSLPIAVLIIPFLVLSLEVFSPCLRPHSSLSLQLVSHLFSPVSISSPQ